MAWKLEIYTFVDLISGHNNYRYHLDHRYRTNGSRSVLFSGFVRYRWPRRETCAANHRYRTKPDKSGAGSISAIPVVEVISVVISAADLGPNFKFKVYYTSRIRAGTGPKSHFLEKRRVRTLPKDPRRRGNHGTNKNSP